MHISYFRVIFTAKNMFQRLIRLLTHPYCIKNSSLMSRKEERRVYTSGEVHLEVSLCVRHLKHQDFLLVVLLLFKGNRTDWNPDTIMPVQPRTDTKRLCDQVCHPLQYCEHNRDCCMGNTEDRLNISGFTYCVL